MAGINRHVLSAIKGNNLEKVSLLTLAPGYDINLDTGKQVTPLSYACKLGFLPIVEKLIALGADIEFADSEGKTVLFHACAKGNRELLQTLIRAGCDINKTNIHGDKPIHEAVIHGNKECLLELIETGSDINEKNRITGHTLLHLAVLHEQADVVQLLLDCGAPPDKSTSEGETALHYGVQIESLPIIQYLVCAGADINKFNNIGETPFIIAIQESKIKSAKLLIDLDCVKEKYHYMYSSAMCLACSRNNHRMILYLLSEGYDVAGDKSLRRWMILRGIEDGEKHPPILDFVQYRIHNPLDLKELCRLGLRKYLKGRIEKGVVKLELPKQLKRYLIKNVIY